MTTYGDLHVALVGCGYWGKNHARVLDGLGPRLTYCDSDAALLGAVSAAYPGHETTAELGSVLADASVDAVVIATPAATHFDIALAAVESGKHVLVEKPMALSPSEGLRLVEVARAASRTLMVGHLLRYHPAVETLAQLVRSGELGQIRYIYSNRLNLGKVRREENALWSFAPHDVSVILHLVDEQPDAVSSTGGAYLQAEVADVSLSALAFPSGVRAHIFVSWLHPYKEQRLVVVGSSAMAVFDDMEADNKLTLHRDDVQLVDGQFVATRSSPRSVDVNSAEPLVEEDRHFLDCVVSGRRPCTDGREGLAVLKVLDACQRSLDSGGTPVAQVSSDV